LTFAGIFSNHRLGMRSTASWQIVSLGVEIASLLRIQRLAEISGT
jgi:hypothetical protein